MSAPVRNASWSWDEIVLACDLVHANGWRYLSDRDPRVATLSALLQALPLHPQSVRGPQFRSAGSVARKTADIATAHPGYPGPRTRGNRLDGEVLRAFLERPAEMRLLAERLRQEASWPAAEPADPDLDGAPVAEGRVLERRHLARERDPRLRRDKLAAVAAGGGVVACEACGFDFAAAYGERGSGFIEVHHRVPLHVSGPTVTSLADLALLCSNCHRMVHRQRPWLTVEQLSDLVAERVPR